MEGVCLGEPEESVVAVAEHGGHVVAPTVVCGLVDHTDGAVAEFGGEQAGTADAGEHEERRPGAASCSTSSSEPGRAGGTGISRRGAPHESPAITVPRWVPNPASTTWSSPYRSRASWPMLTSPRAAMPVARALPTCVLCAHTTALAPGP